MRPALSQLTDRIYIPKLLVKRFSPYFYSGETDLTYHNYRSFQTRNLKEEAQNDQNLVLGIESSFNDTCAAIVRGNGEILSN